MQAALLAMAATADRAAQPTNSSAFNRTLALHLTYFSSAAYCPLPSIADWSCKPCLLADPSFAASPINSSSYGMQAYVGYGSGDIVISFRGSNNLRNWIENLQFAKRSAYPGCKGCEVHDGFFKSWLSVRDGVIKEVTRLYRLHPNARVFLTGHSLGAALAALCAAELDSSQLGISITAVYTFGQPRVGNAAFVDFYKQRSHVSWRATHWRDPVPHLPFEWMGFKHLSTEVFYDSENTGFKVCDGTGEDKSCSDQFRWFAEVSDHLHYLDPPVGEMGTC
ncbi:MAG: hypothetical protein SGPRY_006574 [Prymnesium sp.]